MYNWQQNTHVSEFGDDDNNDDTADSLVRSGSARSVPLNAKVHRAVEFLKISARNKSVSIKQMEAGLSKSPNRLVDLREDEKFLQRLDAHDKVIKTMTPSGELAYSFKSDFPRVYDRKSLVAEVELIGGAVCAKRFEDDACFEGVGKEIKALVRCGDVIGVKNMESRDIVLFPRGFKFLVGLRGEHNTHTAVAGHSRVVTSMDLRAEIRRGDGVGIVGNGAIDWFRVSHDLNGQQRQWAEMPGSLSSVKALGKDRKDADELWADVFTSRELPLDTSYAPTTQSSVPPRVRLVKFGCTNDLRDLWRKTGAKLPKDDLALEGLMRERGLLTSHAPRKRVRLNNDKKPRRRMPSRMKRVTNSHLN